MRSRRWTTAAGLAALAALCGCGGPGSSGGGMKATGPHLAVPNPQSPAPAKGYRLALAGRPYVFPRDHAAHPEYATEWWYYTGHLADDSGRTFGYQLTFFRVGVTPPGTSRASAWAVHDLYFAHMAVTDESRGTYRYFDRISRGSLGEAGAHTDTFEVNIGDWTAKQNGDTHVLHAKQDGWGVEIDATPQKPPVIHGEGGVSQKSKGKGRASYYYSYTRMRTEGRLFADGRAFKVTGISWFDHEFGSNQLAANQVGWDWFSLQMDDGSEAMLYLMRDVGNTPDPYSSGTLVDASGKAVHLRREDYTVEVLDRWRSTESGAEYPAHWRIRIPRAGWDLDVRPTVPDQELRTGGSTGVTYWEGSARVQGTIANRPARGQAYVELTGYAKAFQQTF